MVENNEKDNIRGIAGLPRPWSTAVHLVGTFGLAVFLVLYYVFVMQPQERKRYDELKDAVETLIQVVEKEQTLLTKDQAKHLESLYIIGVANELGVVIHGELKKETSKENLETIVRKKMLQRLELIEGLVKKDGRSLSEPIVHRIAEPTGVCKRLVEIAFREWKTDSVQHISNNLEEFLEFSFAERRMRK